MASMRSTHGGSHATETGLRAGLRGVFGDNAGAAEQLKAVDRLSYELAQKLAVVSPTI